jgi:hypothetical protein
MGCCRAGILRGVPRPLEVVRFGGKGVLDLGTDWASTSRCGETANGDGRMAVGHKYLNGMIRVLVVLPFLAASMALASFAFAGTASAAGGAGPAQLAASAQECDEDAVGCDYLTDYGIGCINGDIVGDVNGTAINCDVDGDVNGTGINTDATGNMHNCINGDPSSVSGSSINCGDGGYAPAPNPNPNPNPQPNPNPNPKPGEPGAPPAVVALPDTGAGTVATGSALSLALLAVAAVAVVGFAACLRLGRAED